MGDRPAPPRLRTEEENVRKKNVVQRAEAAPGPAPRASAVTPLGGSPLPTGVRRFMEPRFGADFGNIRIHTGEAAAQQSAALNAHAFTVGEHVFFGRNRFAPESAAGRELIAHELTHTIQQGAAARRSAGPAIQQQGGVRVQRLGMDEARNWIADKANYLPGFRLLTIILGMNPISRAPVERSGANILRGLLELIPVAGAMIAEALERYGILAKAGAWIDARVRELGLTGSALNAAFTQFLDSLSWRDVLSPGAVWDRAKRIFTEPIERLTAFVRRVVGDLLGLIRDGILLPLARLAEGTRGYDFLKAVLGQDPITGEPVPRTPETLIAGFLKLIGREDIWQNIQRANALPRAWSWFQSTLSTLVVFARHAKTLFHLTLKSLDIVDLLLPWKAFAKLRNIFGNFVATFVAWGLNAVWALLEIIFEAVKPEVLPYIRRTGAALKTIMRNPGQFMRNLFAATKLAFSNFGSNFLTHLKNAFFDWLLGMLPGVYFPKSFDFTEVIKFLFSVFGLTGENFRIRLVKAIGETAVKALETGFTFVATLVRDGPAAAWESIKPMLGGVVEQVINGIMGVVVETVLKKAMMKLLPLIIPGVNIIPIILMIYDMITVFVDKLYKITQAVRAFVDSLVAVATGAVGTAAARIEKGLTDLFTLTINVLIGMVAGKIDDKIKAVIDRVRAPVNRALDTLIKGIVTAAKKLGKFVTAKVGAVIAWWKQKFTFRNKAGESHTLQFIGSGDSAKLGIASEPATVRAYLDSHPDKGSADWKAADAALAAASTIIFSPARKTEDEKKRQKLVGDEMAKLSAALAKLGGEPPSASDYGTSTKPTYDNPAVCEVIVDKPLDGTATGPWPETRSGYKEIFDAGMTEKTYRDSWVQMHIISKELGGIGTNFENLVPAPRSVNSGPFRSFEHGIVKIATDKTGPIKNRVWAQVHVEGPKHAATALKGKAGLYFWKGKSAPQKWLKDPNPSVEVEARIRSPGPHPLSLNYTSKTAMKKDFGLSAAVAAKVYEGRYYASQADFEQSMAKRGAAAADIAAVLGKKPVLDDA